MIRLGETPAQYPGLALSSCGLLFLSTPHSGTEEANWNDLLVELAKLGGSRRSRDFTQLLSAFNRESASAKERFGLLRPLPPFICVYETQSTSVKGLQRMIVTPDSAGLNGERALPMSYADHRTICRFSDKSDQRYLQVLGYLDRIRSRAVESQQQSQKQLQEQTPSQARIGPVPAAPQRIIKGGNARGGNAVSHGPGSSAEGGSAIGGNATASSGGRAVGGSAFGGDASG
ncbi:hypothetical protein QBC44DRAFT_346298 [Cladorrhinum sp. PSN332]|nr:hypothetical protein QBC44DRAFT_346298 [Cladorrhinum sp. PSN332]